MQKEIIGKATLYCGDCRDILPDIDGVDVVITDPPYGIKKEDWDDELPEGIIADLFNIAKTVCVIPGVWALGKCIGAMGNKYVWTIAAHKPAAMTNGRIGFNKWQPIVVGGDVKRTGTDAFDFSQVDNEKTGHSCQKPQELMRWIVKKITMETNTILDPFLGSGSTGVACVTLGRKFIGIEREHKYFVMACKRIEKAQAQMPLFKTCNGNGRKVPEQAGFW